MKKSACMILCVLLLLLSCGSAMADVPVGTEMRVANCSSFITLRWGPDTQEEEIAKLDLGEAVIYLEQAENGFARVGTPWGRGYVLERYLEMADFPKDSRAIGDNLTDQERYNINLFLSNFTEADFAWDKGYFTLDDDAAMVDFAINHVWFNQQDKIEWLDDFDEFNVRLDTKYIKPVTEKYFGVEPKCYAPTWVCWIDSGYFWTETGGHVPSGFAQETAVQTMDDGYYDVWFEVCGDGDNWTNECCGWTLEQARAAYPCEKISVGYACIYAEDLSDRSTFKLVKYAK